MRISKAKNPQLGVSLLASQVQRIAPILQGIRASKGRPSRAKAVSTRRARPNAKLRKRGVNNTNSNKTMVEPNVYPGDELARVCPGVNEGSAPSGHTQLVLIVSEGGKRGCDTVVSRPSKKAKKYTGPSPQLIEKLAAKLPKLKKGDG